MGNVLFLLTFLALESKNFAFGKAKIA